MMKQGDYAMTEGQPSRFNYGSDTPLKHGEESASSVVQQRLNQLHEIIADKDRTIEHLQKMLERVNHDIAEVYQAVIQDSNEAHPRPKYPERH